MARKPKKIDPENEIRYLAAIRKDGARIDRAAKQVFITEPLHPINRERLEELKLRNGFREYVQTSLFPES